MEDNDIELLKNKIYDKLQSIYGHKIRIINISEIRKFINIPFFNFNLKYLIGYDIRTCRIPNYICHLGFEFNNDNVAIEYTTHRRNCITNIISYHDFDIKIMISAINYCIIYNMILYCRSLFRFKDNVIINNLFVRYCARDNK